MEPIVLATGNPHKVGELRAIFAGAGLPVRGLRDLPNWESLTEPAETGSTFEENATIKALSYAQQTGLPCLADDSGLEVDALGGRPGVISSHYSTDGRETGLSRAERDRLNNERLLNDLAGVPPERRTARFVCVMVLVRPFTGGTGFQPVENSNERTVERSLPLRPCDMTAVNRSARDTLAVSRGDLPHWHEGGRTYFIAFRTDGSMLTPAERDIVLGGALHWHSERALIHLVVVMPDHVHVLMTPTPKPDSRWHEVPKLIHSIKSWSANQINRVRGRAGSLWQPEYFDRIMRDGDEFQEKWNYMVSNPVHAGLVSTPMEYPWTAGGSQLIHRLEAGATRGTLAGRIGLPGEVPRGGQGFGYDPLFLVAPDFARTSAELPPAEKNRLSHRAAAAAAMARLLAGA